MLCSGCQENKKEEYFYWNKSKSKYESKCKDCMRQARKDRYKADPDIELCRNLKYCEQNKTSVNKYKAEWARKNKKNRTSYARKKYQSDPIYRLKSCLRARLTAVVAGKHESTMELVGCSIEELKKHLECQFIEGMSWENYGEWHVDHMKPCASFNLSDPEQQRLCFNYKNLQPLWAVDNLRKGALII